MKINSLLTVLSVAAAQFLFLSEAAAKTVSETGPAETAAAKTSSKGEVSWNVELFGFGATESTLPFWAVTNKHGLVPNAHGGLLIGGASLKYVTKPAIDLYAGVSLAGSATPGNFQGMVDELYFGIGWKKLRLDLGMIDRSEDLFNGLSLTGGNIIVSGNARNFAGYNLSTDFIYIPGTKKILAFKANFADYKMLDNRYVKGVLLHNEALYLKIALHKRVEFTAGLEIWSQWAGTMPASGDRTEPFKQPCGFKDYIRVIFGRGGGSDATVSDQINALGNHLGHELFRLTFNMDKYIITVQHDIPFEDGSGMGFQNYPDGVTTFSYAFRDKRKWVSDFVYELAYTLWQSGPHHDRPANEEELARDPNKTKYVIGGGDNYFNNGEYRSGWTYYGRTIGLPLIAPVAPNEDGIVLGVYNNRLVAHHVGIGGMIARKLPYKILFTYSRNRGTYANEIENRADQYSCALETTLPQLGRKLPVSLTLGLYGDAGKLYPDNFGLTLKLNWYGATKW